MLITHGGFVFHKPLKVVQKLNACTKYGDHVVLRHMFYSVHGYRKVCFFDSAKQSKVDDVSHDHYLI